MAGRADRWRPVRMTLDLRAFGTNAYTANEAGVDVVEPHDEDPKLAHEELYFVHRGSARFTLDGESFDAPAGTYVRVDRPDGAPPRRRARAGHDGPELRRAADVHAVGLGVVVQGGGAAP